MWCTRKQTLNKTMMKEMPARFHAERSERERERKGNLFRSIGDYAIQCNAQVLSCRFRFFRALGRMRRTQ